MWSVAPMQSMTGLAKADVKNVNATGVDRADQRQLFLSRDVS